VISADPRTIDARAIFLFYGVAFILNCLLALPLWLGREGLHASIALELLSLMMFTPAIGVVIVRFLLPKSIQPIVEVTGLGTGSLPKCLYYWLFGWFGITALVLAAPFVGALLGMYTLDLENFSGLRQLLRHQPGDEAIIQKVPLHTLLLIQFTQLLIAPGTNAVFAFGEEWGWRGFLLFKLLPLGQWPALVFSGALWGLWHTPVVLLGYNYPLHPRFGVLLMTIFCVIMGILLGWTRLATGSIWPAVIGHGTLNAAGAFGYVFADADQTIDTAHVTIVGWTGWILPLLTILLLIALKRLPLSEPR
jgi:membrane protease YdiL (CAAX protease family)